VGNLSDLTDKGTPRLALENEFASVHVTVDHRANGPRLRIEDQRNRRVTYLDPLEVASLVWVSHDSLGPFLDPSRTGWRNDEGAEVGWH
jgi:hypothetical protein